MDKSFHFNEMGDQYTVLPEEEVNKYEESADNFTKQVLGDITKQIKDFKYTSNYKFIIKNTDFLIPVCDQGMNRSQVMRRVLIDLQRNVFGRGEEAANKWVSRTHGALVGCDPYNADENNEPENWFNYLYQHLHEWFDNSFAAEGQREGEGDEMSLNRAFNSVFYQKKLERLGEEKAVQEKLFDAQKNLKEGGDQDHEAPHKILVSVRKNMRDWFNKHVFAPMSSLKNKPHVVGGLNIPAEAKRRIFICLPPAKKPHPHNTALATQIVHDRLCEVVGGPEDTVVIEMGLSDPFTSAATQLDSLNNNTLKDEVMRKVHKKGYYDYNELLIGDTQLMATPYARSVQIARVPGQQPIGHPPIGHPPIGHPPISDATTKMYDDLLVAVKTMDYKNDHSKVVYGIQRCREISGVLDRKYTAKESGGVGVRVTGNVEGVRDQARDVEGVIERVLDSGHVLIKLDKAPTPASHEQYRLKQGQEVKHAYINNDLQAISPPPQPRVVWNTKWKGTQVVLDHLTVYPINIREPEGTKILQDNGLSTDLYTYPNPSGQPSAPMGAQVHGQQPIDLTPISDATTKMYDDLLVAVKNMDYNDPMIGEGIQRCNEIIGVLELKKRAKESGGVGVQVFGVAEKGRALAGDVKGVIKSVLDSGHVLIQLDTPSPSASVQFQLTKGKPVENPYINKNLQAVSNPPNPIFPGKVYPIDIREPKGTKILQDNDLSTDLYTYPLEYVIDETIQHEFLDAAKSYDWKKVMEMVHKWDLHGPNIINVTPKGRMSALHQAVEGGHLDTVKFLLSRGADKNAIHQGKNMKSFTSNPEILQLLGA